MNIYVTSIRAICPHRGELISWCGPHVKAISPQMARDYCDNNGLGYLKIEGELVAEIPCIEGTYNPDFDNMTEYDTAKNN